MIKEQDIEQEGLSAENQSATEKKQRKGRPKKPEKLERELPILYDNYDAMQMLHISESTLYRLRKNNQIPFTKIGKKYFYPESYFKSINQVDSTK
jgi:hypothetical protein